MARLGKFLGPVFHELAGQRRSQILEGHMVQDHVHMLIHIPPKYSVAEVIGYSRGNQRLRWLGSLEHGKGILMGSGFGQEAMRSRPLDLRRNKLGSTSEIRSSLIPKDRTRTVSSTES
jgi:REP element-mobilizing transposase RayT